MKKSGILHAELAGHLARLGHTDQFLVVDSGFPVPPGVPVVDLRVVYGLPGFAPVLTAVAEQQARGFGKARLAQLLAGDNVDRNRAFGDGAIGAAGAGDDQHAIGLILGHRVVLRQRGGGGAGQRDIDRRIAVRIGLGSHGGRGGEAGGQQSDRKCDRRAGMENLVSLCHCLPLNGQIGTCPTA